MKTLVYGAVLGILVVLTFGVLAIYYSSPFSEDFDFKESVNYADIQIQKTIGYNNQEMLSSATADIGTLELENKGYFSRVYYLPYIIGCIDLREGNKNSLLSSQNQFNVNFKENENQIYSSLNYPYSNQKIEIPKGKSKKLILTAQYSQYNIPFSEFSKDKIKSISIYVFENNEENPIKVNEYDFNYGYQNCQSLKDEKSDAVILIN